MEEDGQETPRTPFWIQTTTNVRRAELYRRRASSLFFNAGVLIIFLLFLAILSMVFIIPSLVSFTSHTFKPNLVKKSWDSINLVLVLFALAFGFLSRNINNDDNKSRFDNGFGRSRSDLSAGAPVSSPANSTPRQWYDFPEQPITGLRRHRSTSSYPDLREMSPPWNRREEASWRFSDDTHLSYDRYYFRREQDPDIKDIIHVDSVVDLPKEDSFTPPPPSQPPASEIESHSPSPKPPSPQSLPAAQLDTTINASEHPFGAYDNVAALAGETSSSSEVNKVRFLETETETESPEFQVSDRKVETGIGKRGKGERRRARSLEHLHMVSPVSDPVPEISPELQGFEQKIKLDRKKSGAKATKDFLTSLYQKKKKKRQRQRSLDNLDNFIHHTQPPVTFQLPPPSPPPPPPPPPPPSILNNLFTKKERRKKIPSTPPPPPLPPPHKAARGPKPTTTRVSPFVTEKPKAPVKMSFFNSIDDSSSGGESPVSRIPPPPPMPPFKMPDWKFAVEGDYVRVQSILSSGSVSPDGDESQSPSSAVASPSPAFCPSPDVDTKADTFIARFRAGLKLEKINSFNQNQSNRMSNLGPGPGPSQSNRF